MRGSGGVEDQQLAREAFTVIFEKRGDKPVIHGLRGKLSNQRLAGSVKQEAIKILAVLVDQGFWPTLAEEVKGTQVPIWRPRPCRCGELVQRIPASTIRRNPRAWQSRHQFTLKCYRRCFAFPLNGVPERLPL